MSHTATQQFSEVNQKNVDIIHDFIRTSLDGLEKLTKLNLETSRKLIEEASDSFKDMSCANNPQELMDKVNRLATTSVENNIVNCRDAFDVISATQSKINKMFETHFKDVHANASDALETLSSFSPAAKSNLATESIKIWMNNATQAMSAFQKAASQAGEFTSNNIKATPQATSTRTTTKKPSKK